MRYYTVKTGDTLAQIAQQFGITITDLKRKNKLLNNILRVGQQLEIPATPPKDTQIKDNQAKDNENITNTDIDFENSIPMDFPEYENISKKIIEKKIIENEPKTYPHRILINESWHSIAKMYQTTITTLKKLNPLLGKDLRVGADIKILAQDFEKIHPENTFFTHQHTVVRGDTLSGIAQKYKVNTENLKQWNNLQTGLLEVGQVLVVRKVEENQSLLTPKRGTSPLTPEGGIEEENIELKNEIPENSEEVNDEIPENLEENIDEEAPPLGAGGLEISENLEENIDEETPPLVTEGLEIPPLEDEEILEDEIGLFAPPLGAGGLNENINYQTARLIFRIESPLYTSETLQNSVGMYHVSKPDDVEKIQKKLVDKGFLAYNHEESPTNIYQREGRVPLTANFLPKTLEALQEFQEAVDIPFWHSFFIKKYPKEKLNYTWGVIKPNDLTHKILQENDQLVISFPHPHTGKRFKWQLTNYIASENSIFPQNYTTEGQSKPEIPMNVWQRLGLTLPLAEIMQNIVEELGYFDAFCANEKDLKYGILPFKNEEIIHFVRYTFKKSLPLFQECFGQFGILVDDKNNVIIRDDNSPNSQETALEKIRNYHIITAIFGRAGYYLPMITLQLDFLLQNYIFPSLGLDVKIVTPAQTYMIDLVDVLANAEGLKVLFKKVLKNGLDNAQREFEQALQRLANARQLHTPAHWQDVRMQDIIWQVME